MWSWCHSLLPFDADGKVLGHEASLDGLNADGLQVGGKGGQRSVVWVREGRGGV